MGVLRSAKLALIGAFLCGSVSAGAQQHSCKPDYFIGADFEHQPSVWSPDHSERIRLLKNLTMRVEVNGRDLGALEVPDDPVNTMIKWSRDSRAFYVQVGGNAISGQVIAYAVVDGKLEELRAPKVIAKEFAKHHFCKERGNNLYAIRWQEGSQQLLLMPEVYDTGDCGAEMGFTEGYLAEAATGRILKRYSSIQIEAMQRECWPDKLLNHTPKKSGR